MKRNIYLISALTAATPDQFLRWNSETQPQTFHAYYPVTQTS